MSGLYTTLFVAHRDAPGALAALTGALAAAEMNIAFCRTYRTEQGGQAYTVFETDGRAQGSILADVRSLELVDWATFIELPGSVTAHGPGVSVPEIFDDAAQLLDVCRDQSVSIGAVMAAREAALRGEDAAEASMRRVIAVMREETTAPIEHPEPSLGGFIGGAWAGRAESLVPPSPRGDRAAKAPPHGASAIRPRVIATWTDQVIVPIVILEMRKEP